MAAVYVCYRMNNATLLLLPRLAYLLLRCWCWWWWWLHAEVEDFAILVIVEGEGGVEVDVILEWNGHHCIAAQAVCTDIFAQSATLVLALHSRLTYMYHFHHRIVDLADAHASLFDVRQHARLTRAHRVDDATGSG